MATQIVMPALGMQQDTGTLLAWLKAEGESVSQGEPIMEIETDKATVEIEAPASGILAGVCAKEGDRIPVGQIIAYILAPGETVPISSAGARQDSLYVPPISQPPSAEALEAAGLGEQESRCLQQPRLPPASPKARSLARERGLEIQRLIGTGPGGAVLAADMPAPTVSQAVPPRPPEEDRGVAGAREPTKGQAVPAATESLEPGSKWQVMADRVSRSWVGAPHFFLLREANASRLMAWRAAAQLQTPALTYTDLLVKLAAAALSRHPRLNASWNDGRIVVYREINIGIAVAVPDGLVVPVIHRAEALSLSQIAESRQELIRRAESGKLSVADLADGTFTVSNLGMYGIDAFLAILNPPQAAILAVGRVAERVVPVEGRPAVQPTLVLSLSCDHRVVDGARAAQFLETLTHLVEEPLLLL